MCANLVVQYCGSFAKPAECVSGDAESMRVILRMYDAGGSPIDTLLHCGDEFSEEEFHRKLNQQEGA